MTVCQPGRSVRLVNVNNVPVNNVPVNNVSVNNDSHFGQRYFRVPSSVGASAGLANGVSRAVPAFQGSHSGFTTPVSVPFSMQHDSDDSTILTPAPLENSEPVFTKAS